MTRTRALWALGTAAFVLGISLCSCSTSTSPTASTQAASDAGVDAPVDASGNGGASGSGGVGGSAGSTASDAGAGAPDAGPIVTHSYKIEIRDPMDATFSGSGDAFTITLDLHGQGYGFLDASSPLTLQGKVSHLPEAEGTLISGKGSSGPVIGSPCGDTTALSIAFAAFGRDAAGRSAGALTVYCGANNYIGVPSKVLRFVEVLPDAGP